MGHDHGGDVHFIVEVAQPGTQFLAHLGIEGAEGFIQQQNPGLDGKGAGQGYPLALATGELGGETAAIALQLNQIEKFIDAAFNGVPLPAAQLQAEGHVLAHGAVLEQGKVLEDKPHLAVLDGALGGLFAGNPDAAAVAALQTGDQAQQGAFA